MVCVLAVVHVQAVRIFPSRQGSWGSLCRLWGKDAKPAENV